MRTCGRCGFDNAEEEKECPLCGATDTADTQIQEEAATAIATMAVLTPEETAEIRLPAGHVFANRYKVLRFLGKGGMGAVYKVHDETLHKDMALKIMHSWIAREASGTERFKREAEILSHIRHPSVPRILGFGIHEKDLYYVAEFIEGRDLKEEIRRKRSLPCAEAVKLIASVADALGAAHALGIVHRDVKPSNIMVSQDGKVKLLDFGIARKAGPEMATITQTGVVVGTPEYMSPEHFDSHTVDARSDIYSLGVVFFEMLTGQLPFAGHTPLAIAMKHRTEPPPPPRSLRNDIPVWVNRIVLRCLEKDPAKRFDSMNEFITHLRKPRKPGAPQRHPSGDWISENATDGALEISTSREKTGWVQGMALLYSSQHFKLSEIAAPEGKGGKWSYQFEPWPAQEAFRKVVDYEQDCAHRREADAASLAGRLKGIIRKHS